MSMNNTDNLLDVDNVQLIEVFQKALVILSKDYGERSIEEDEWVEKEPHVFRLLDGDVEGSPEQLDTLESEVNRLNSLIRFTIASMTANISAISNDSTDPMDPDLAMSAELAALESRIAEELRVGRARIAEKYGRRVESLELMKLPTLSKNTGLRTGYGAYLSEQFSDQDREDLKRDSKQMGNIIARKASGWNALTVEEKEVFKSKAKAFNEKEGKAVPFSLETKARRFNLLSNCLTRNLYMLREECGVESICFVAPCNTQTSFDPPQSGFGSECGHRFFNMMKRGEVEFSPISFQREFHFRMLQFNADDRLASASATRSAFSNEIQTTETRLQPTKQHAYNTWLKNQILDKYKQAVKDFYGCDIVGESMKWHDEKMYKDIVLQGWPEGVKRASPCYLTNAKKRKVEENLDEIRFVINPNNSIRTNQSSFSL
ncbi:hypothetical protein INT45_009662 [Circinella minor]|uniref:HMG box domain-containing protein n=1 Tax=Circinella minor TaxID=1195481 RepID=A0A8H7RU88_9FUNG|nr:hypothetical protein INT45_009662 [Circinella minor]